MYKIGDVIRRIGQGPYYWKRLKFVPEGILILDSVDEREIGTINHNYNCLSYINLHSVWVLDETFKVSEILNNYEER